MSSSTTRLSAILVMASALAIGCGSAVETGPASSGTSGTPTDAGSQIPTAPGATESTSALQEVRCEGNTACPAGFVFEGRTFLIDCTAVGAGSMANEPLASGSLLGSAIEIRGIAGVDSSSFLAVNWPGADPCPSAWTLAIEERVSPEALGEALCGLGASASC